MLQRDGKLLIETILEVSDMKLFIIRTLCNLFLTFKTVFFVF